MVNSDTAFGLHNKITKIIYQYESYIAEDSSEQERIKSQSFSANVTTVKNYFMTTEALACIDDNGTQVAYGITADGNGLKWTVAFGTPADASQKSWAEKYRETKESLSGSNGWFKSSLLSTDPTGGVASATNIKITDSDEHLF